jgi:Protein of unknown function (DUF4240)
MDSDGFWELIERSRQETSDQLARLQWLQEQLARQPTAEIVDFQVWVDRLELRAYNWPLWGAAHLICDGLCSDDGFFYFRLWLIGLGREAFELAMAHPDNLAGLPEVVALMGRPMETWDRDEWPDWQGLHSVAWAAYEQVTEGQDLYDAIEAGSDDRPLGPLPAGEGWNFDDAAEAELRLPRLSWMFPLTDQATRDQRGREAFEQLLAERGQTEEEFIRDVLGGAYWTEPPGSDPS